MGRGYHLSPLPHSQPAPLEALGALYPFPLEQGTMQGVMGARWGLRADSSQVGLPRGCLHPHVSLGYVEEEEEGPLTSQEIIPARGELFPP